MNINHGKEAPPVLCQGNRSTLLHFLISPSFRKEMAELSRRTAIGSQMQASLKTIFFV